MLHRCVINSDILAGLDCTCHNIWSFLPCVVWSVRSFKSKPTLNVRPTKHDPSAHRSTHIPKAHSLPQGQDVRPTIASSGTETKPGDAPKVGRFALHLARRFPFSWTNSFPTSHMVGPGQKASDSQRECFWRVLL